MITLAFWLWALFCPNPNNTPDNNGNHSNGQVSTFDTGGDTGNFPPKPPTPPPPPGH